jgi:hypothetical protein
LNGEPLIPMVAISTGPDRVPPEDYAGRLKKPDHPFTHNSPSTPTANANCRGAASPDAEQGPPRTRVRVEETNPGVSEPGPSVPPREPSERRTRATLRTRAGGCDRIQETFVPTPEKHRSPPASRPSSRRSSPPSVAAPSPSPRHPPRRRCLFRDPAALAGAPAGVPRGTAQQGRPEGGRAVDRAAGAAEAVAPTPRPRFPGDGRPGSAP